MRIMTGKYKGKAIHMPKGIRPTQNKVRKAIFDILGDITGLSFLEIFAGSGAVGFEAVSRGARELVLVEYNRDCQLAIRRNIESLAIKSCSLYPHEADKAVKFLRKEDRRFDIIFLDPPYYQELSLRLRSGSMKSFQERSLSKKALQTLEAYDILAPDGFILVQHFIKDKLPQGVGQLVLVKEAKYGDTVLSFYKKQVSV